MQWFIQSSTSLLSILLISLSPVAGVAAETSPARTEQSAAQAAEAAIRHALEQKTEMEFVELPLADVVEYLAKKHNIEIQLDAPATSSLPHFGCGQKGPEVSAGACATC